MRLSVYIEYTAVIETITQDGNIQFTSYMSLNSGVKEGLIVNIYTVF